MSTSPRWWRGDALEHYRFRRILMVEDPEVVAVLRKLATQGWDADALQRWYPALPVAEPPPALEVAAALGGAARDKQIVELRLRTPASLATWWAAVGCSGVVHRSRFR